MNIDHCRSRSFHTDPSLLLNHSTSTIDQLLKLHTGIYSTIADHLSQLNCGAIYFTTKSIYYTYPVSVFFRYHRELFQS